jgi:hypothetical protein
MVCRSCGARRSEGELCPFCGHDSAFERIQSTQRTIGWFWKAVYALVAATGVLILTSIYHAMKYPTGQ